MVSNLSTFKWNNYIAMKGKLEFGSVVVGFHEFINSCLQLLFLLPIILISFERDIRSGIISLLLYKSYNDLSPIYHFDLVLS